MIHKENFLAEMLFINYCLPEWEEPQKMIVSVRVSF